MKRTRPVRNTLPWLFALQQNRYCVYNIKHTHASDCSLDTALLRYTRTQVLLLKNDNEVLPVEVDDANPFTIAVLGSACAAENNIGELKSRCGHVFG